MTILAIYTAGALFFLIQAHLYAKVTSERIIVALTWPLLIFVLPALYREWAREKADLCIDERMAIKSFKIGDRWGIGQ